ncbi:MAG: putative sporulation protein YtxC [Clostridium sp.]
MLVLKLAYNDNLDFIKELQELRMMLKEKSIIIGLVESAQADTHIVKIICDEALYNEKVGNLIHLYISNILYKVVIKKYKEKELFDYLIDNYFFLKQEEILEVEEEIMKVLYCEETLKNDNLVFCMNKMNRVTEKIKECLEENNEININGFITFRMKELREDIEAIIDKVVETYMVEKEYKEFVKLLKYFVDIQESKIDEVNIYVQGNGSYIIKDGEGNDIFIEFMKELTECKADTDANVEDIIISGLITNAPKCVCIHKKEYCKNKEFIDTIVNVFENRVVFCDGCIFCTEAKIKV